MVEVFAVACFRAIELITILNRCHRFRGFVYSRARFSPDHKNIEVWVRPRKGFAAICSRCHRPAPGKERTIESFQGFSTSTAPPATGSNRKAACERIV
jgi:hypothetical protein